MAVNKHVHDDCESSVRTTTLSYAGRRGEIKRLAIEQGCWSDQALAMVLTDVERLAKS
jgi:hypothetical protein